MAFDIEKEYQNLEESIRAYNPNADFAHIRLAFEYARGKHEGQSRKMGLPI